MFRTSVVSIVANNTSLILAEDVVPPQSLFESIPLPDSHIQIPLMFSPIGIFAGH